MNKIKYVICIIMSIMLLTGCGVLNKSENNEPEEYIAEEKIEENNLERISKFAEINKNTMADVNQIYKLLSYDIIVSGTNEMILSHNEGDIIFIFNDNGILSDIMLEKK